MTQRFCFSSSFSSSSSDAQLMEASQVHRNPSLGKLQIDEFIDLLRSHLINSQLESSIFLRFLQYQSNPVVVVSTSKIYYQQELIANKLIV